MTAAWHGGDHHAAMLRYRESLGRTNDAPDGDEPDPIEKIALQQTAAREAAGIKPHTMSGPPLHILQQMAA